MAPTPALTHCLGVKVVHCPGVPVYQCPTFLLFQSPGRDRETHIFWDRQPETCKEVHTEMVPTWKCSVAVLSLHYTVVVKTSTQSQPSPTPNTVWFDTKTTSYHLTPTTPPHHRNSTSAFRSINWTFIYHNWMLSAWATIRGTTTALITTPPPTKITWTQQTAIYKEVSNNKWATFNFYWPHLSPIWKPTNQRTITTWLTTAISTITSTTTYNKWFIWKVKDLVFISRWLWRYQEH